MGSEVGIFEKYNNLRFIDAEARSRKDECYQNVQRIFKYGDFLNIYQASSFGRGGVFSVS